MGTGEDKITDGAMDTDGTRSGTGARAQTWAGTRAGEPTPAREAAPAVPEVGRRELAVVVCLGRREVIRVKHSGRYFDPFRVLCDHDGLLDARRAEHAVLHNERALRRAECAGLVYFDARMRCAASPPLDKKSIAIFVVCRFRLFGFLRRLDVRVRTGS